MNGGHQCTEGKRGLWYINPVGGEVTVNPGSVQDEIKKLKGELRRLKRLLRELSPSIEALLRKRGLRIYKREPGEDLLLPQRKYLSNYYRMLHKYSFRLFLRDVIKFQKGFTPQDVTRYATEEVTQDYISYLKKIGLLRKSAGLWRLTRSIKSFGETLEWFFAEILKREFLMEATWGVRFKSPDSSSLRPQPGGDFDVIAKFDGELLYAEVKSSPPKQIYQKEIRAFLKRIKMLKPELSIFFMDTELRMKDKIVPMFEEEFMTLRESQDNQFLPPIERIEKEIFHAGNFLYIMNSKDSIVHNMETVLSWYHRNKPAVRFF